MTGSKIKVGVIGLGWPGRKHLEGMASHPAAKAVAAADRDPERCAQARKDFGLERTYTDYREMLEKEDLDAVGVALPNFLHAPVTIDCLRAGANVICEKPLALNAREAQSMVDEARKADRLLMLGVQRRFGAVERAARRVAESGRLGEIYHARSQWLRTRGIPIGAGGWFVDRKRAGGGALIDIGVHMLDIAWFVLGHPKPVSVTGVAYRKFASLVPEGVEYTVDDSAFALIRFDQGPSLQLAASWALNNPERQPEVETILYGTEATLDITHPEGPRVVSYNGKNEPKIEPVPLPERKDGFELQMRHFVDCVLGDAECVSPGEQGVTIMKMLDAVYESSETGREVRLD